MTETKNDSNFLNPLNTGMISIDRPWAYFWSARKFSILIDGRKFGSVSNKSVADFFVEPGTHTVSVEVDFSKTEPLQIEVAANQKCILTCRATPSIQYFTNPMIWFSPNKWIELQFSKTAKIEDY